MVFLNVKYYKNMQGITIKNGFIDFEKTDFSCPNCKLEYNDVEGKYLNKQYKEKALVKTINCKCGKPFYLTLNYKSEYVSFI